MSFNTCSLGYLLLIQLVNVEMVVKFFKPGPSDSKHG